MEGLTDLMGHRRNASLPVDACSWYSLKMMSASKLPGGVPACMWWMKPLKSDYVNLNGEIWILLPDLPSGNMNVCVWPMPRSCENNREGSCLIPAVTKLGGSSYFLRIKSPDTWLILWSRYEVGTFCVQNSLALRIFPANPIIAWEYIHLEGFDCHNENDLLCLAVETFPMFPFVSRCLLVCAMII